MPLTFQSISESNLPDDIKKDLQSLKVASIEETLALLRIPELKEFFNQQFGLSEEKLNRLASWTISSKNPTSIVWAVGLCGKFKNTIFGCGETVRHISDIFRRSASSPSINDTPMTLAPAITGARP